MYEKEIEGLTTVKKTRDQMVNSWDFSDWKDCIKWRIHNDLRRIDVARLTGITTARLTAFESGIHEGEFNEWGIAISNAYQNLNLMLVQHELLTAICEWSPTVIFRMGMHTGVVSQLNTLGTLTGDDLDRHYDQAWAEEVADRSCDPELHPEERLYIPDHTSMDEPINQLTNGIQSLIKCASGLTAPEPAHLLGESLVACVHEFLNQEELRPDDKDKIMSLANCLDDILSLPAILGEESKPVLKALTRAYKIDVTPAKEGEEEELPENIKPINEMATDAVGAML